MNPPDINALIESAGYSLTLPKKDMDTNPDKPWNLSRGLLQGLVVLAGAFLYCAYQFISEGTRIEVVFLIFIVFLIIAGVVIIFQRLFSPDFVPRLEDQQSGDRPDEQEIAKK